MWQISEVLLSRVLYGPISISVYSFCSMGCENSIRVGGFRLPLCEDREDGQILLLTYEGLLYALLRL